MPGGGRRGLEVSMPEGRSGSRGPTWEGDAGGWRCWDPSRGWEGCVGSGQGPLNWTHRPHPLLTVVGEFD